MPPPNRAGGEGVAVHCRRIEQVDDVLELNDRAGSAIDFANNSRPNGASAAPRWQRRGMSGGRTMTAVSVFTTCDYTVLPTEAAALAKRTAQKFRQHWQRNSKEIIELGTDLVRLKEALGHGRFGEWLEAEFGCNARTAQRVSPEQIIQRSVCQHLRTRGTPGLVLWHTPNGGRRNRTEVAIFAGLGVRSGVADLILLHDGRALALELKADAGRPTTTQRQFVSDFNAAGGTAAITNGLDQALRTLEAWRLSRGRLA
jgi:hypothetical protein